MSGDRADLREVGHWSGSLGVYFSLAPSCLMSSMKCTIVLVPGPAQPPAMELFCSSVLVPAYFPVLILYCSTQGQATAGQTPRRGTLNIGIQPVSQN